MRLIDADEIGLTDFEIVMCEGSYKNALGALIYKISNAPTVDAVPVVRCKDCKYLFKVKNGIFVTYGCERNWCCYAERKEK